MNKSLQRNYEPQHLIDRRNSPAFHLATYRNPETTAKEKMMDEFLFFVEEKFDMSQDDLSDLQSLVNAFIGYDIKKAEQGEQELLKRWKESVK